MCGGFRKVCQSKRLVCGIAQHPHSHFSTKSRNETILCALWTSYNSVVCVQYDQYRDIESQEELLAPGMSKTDNMLRWGFIRKVQPVSSLV